MEAVKELVRLRERIQVQLRELQLEFDVVNKAIQLLEREGQPEVNDKRFAKMGLSEACRQIVNGDWITPSGVRDILMRGGFKNENKSKLLGYVFATLKRLQQASEFEVKRIDDRLKYRKKQAATTDSGDLAA
jgi:hypothetical protein